jgi:hypothetical protein
VRFFAHVQTGPGAHPASCTMGTGSFPGVKRPERGADHPPPSSAKVRKEYSYTSTHHLGLRVCYGVALPYILTVKCFLRKKIAGLLWWLCCVRQTLILFFISETSRYSDFYKRHNACHSKSIFSNYFSEVPNGGHSAWKTTVNLWTQEWTCNYRVNRAQSDRKNKLLVMKELSPWHVAKLSLSCSCIYYNWSNRINE